MKKPLRLVIIGNGPVAHTLLETLAASGKAGDFSVTILGEEPHYSYDRVHLTHWFQSRSAESILLGSDAFYRNHGYVCHQNCRATAIDRIRRVVVTENSQEIPYDRVVLATGSSPFLPPIPGRERKNVFTYRTINDLSEITDAAKEGKVGAVIGGGLMGLEAAKALRDLGLATHVVEFAPRLMAVQMDEGGGAMLRRKIEQLGVTIHTQKNTTAISEGKESLHRMEFADGSQLETDIVLFSAGIRPRDELGRLAGLGMGARGGVVINNYCQTSDPEIYAIGEVALWNNRIFGLIAPGNEMARVAVDHLTGSGERQFQGANMSTKLKLMGVDVASIGDAHGTTPGCRSYTYVNDREEIYKKLVVSSDDSELLGAVLVGDAKEYGNLLQLMLNRIALPKEPESLILPATAKSAAPGVELLPDSAILCSCKNVSKKDLADAVQQGANTLAALKECTGAATGCGGCAGVVTQLLHSEMARLGITVNRNLCEHFAYTRQELYHLIRVGKIRRFGDLLARHGNGMGCDICKTTAASIFASCWNEHILEKPLHGLQDTNDFFMGNIQKDGTYSVVPRVAGGEITPRKLIVLGEIAEKYKLYTKITGGQRVDLFGARAEQLPLIWRELVDAGFETGHAYGKSLRTCKSCVGSTWCRFGVQDSVGMAVLLENRYKGLRSPHKLKMAVSGCARECAEAQCKDVGIIATSNGWNLYVGGNGGMKPRHADLLATDLDDVTLIRTIDRFFLFYIRTADRLQRTSTWLDTLEGGLDYLRGVILDDKLGIGAELESEMASVIASYRCEWKATLEDPEKMARFGTPESCLVDEILPGSGRAIRIDGEEVAVFRIGEGENEKLYAVSNRCPASGANVIARGITGNLGDRVVVASPIYKQHFDLATGECLEEPGKTLTTYPVRRNGKRVEISLQQEVTP